MVHNAPHPAIARPLMLTSRVSVMGHDVVSGEAVSRLTEYARFSSTECVDGDSTIKTEWYCELGMPDKKG